MVRLVRLGTDLGGINFFQHWRAGLGGWLHMLVGCLVQRWGAAGGVLMVGLVWLGTDLGGIYVFQHWRGGLAGSTCLGGV
jgi:hypothetical protein